MDSFFTNLAGTAWSFVPILLIFFLMAGIMFVFYYKQKTEEMANYLKSIAQSLEKLSHRYDDNHYFR